MIIALCGMDGSGKSTLAAALKDEVEKRGRSAVVIAPYRYFLLTSLLELVKKVRGRENKQITRAGNPFLLKKNKNLLFTFWPFIALVDHWTYFVFKIKPLDWRYDYVISDRFYYDFAAGYKYFGYTNSFVERLYLRLIPRADKTFVLDLDPEEARDREQGEKHKLDFFKNQREYYLKLATKFDLNLIDTSGFWPDQNLSNAICRAVFDNV